MALDGQGPALGRQPGALALRIGLGLTADQVAAEHEPQTQLEVGRNRSLDEPLDHAGRGAGRIAQVGLDRRLRHGIDGDGAGGGDRRIIDAGACQSRLFGAHLAADESVLAQRGQIGHLPAHGVEGQRHRGAAALGLQQAVVGRLDVGVFTRTDLRVSNEGDDLAGIHVGKRLRQHHVGGRHQADGQASTEEAAGHSDRAVDQRIDHRLVAGQHRQRARRQVGPAHQGLGLAADSVAGHHAADAEAADRRHIDHPQEGIAHAAGTLELQIGRGAVRGVTAKGHPPHRAALGCGHGQHDQFQPLGAEGGAVSVLGTQDGLAHLVVGGRGEDVAGLVGLAAVAEFQVEAGVGLLVLQPDLIDAAARSLAGADGAGAGLQPGGQVDHAQLRAVGLGAIKHHIGIAAGRHRQAGFGQRLAQRGLDQRGLVAACGRGAAVAHGLGLHCQAPRAGGGEHLGLDLADVHALGRAGDHDVEGPAGRPASLRGDGHVVGTEPGLQRRLQCGGLALGIGCQRQVQVGLAAERQAEGRARGHLAIDQRQALLLGLALADVEHLDGVGLHRASGQAERSAAAGRRRQRQRLLLGSAGGPGAAGTERRPDRGIGIGCQVDEQQVLGHAQH